MKKFRGGAAIIAVCSLSILGISTANAANNPKPIPAEEKQAYDLLRGTGHESENLTLPIVGEEMSVLASSLTEAFERAPEFASAEVTASRDRVIVHWNGDRSQALSDLLSKHSSVPVEVRQTKFVPGLLRQEAAKLAESQPAITAFEINHDGSGIVVTTDDDADTQDAANAALDLQKQSGIPIEVETSTPVAANSRQMDINYHVGGSRLYNFNSGGGCSSGFAVRQSGTNKEGIMFAAHCGPVGHQWGVWDQVSPTAYSWGFTVARNTTFDGAIIDSGWSQERVWNGTYTATTHAAIRGSAAQFVGQEICYSGGYSGTLCGNIVQAANITYSLGGDLLSVNGFRTAQINGQPAVGNGDSGGPGYSFVSDSTGYTKRLAVGIISAIPAGSSSTCRGIPGSTATGGRKCSSTVFSTPVKGISSATGWFVPEYP